MEYLIKEGELELNYKPNNGAWTYYIQIPNTKHLKGKWGTLKVSGYIDNYKIDSKNLFTITGEDKRLSVNDEIRKYINKSAGDKLTVTLFLIEKQQQITEEQILLTFETSNVLKTFEKLSSNEKEKILNSITSQKSEDKQIKLILKQIDILNKI